MIVSDLFISKDVCPVCGQTPCNCTHVAEGNEKFQFVVYNAKTGEVKSHYNSREEAEANCPQGYKVGKKQAGTSFVSVQGVAEGTDQELVKRQVSYWDQVAKEKKNKEREALKAKKAEYEKTPAGKAEKYWSQKGVAEGLGLYGPFTATINTGERPKSRTKTKKFRREDDAILWAQDWLEDAPQYVFATAQVTDPDGNVVWTTDESVEEGVAEGEQQKGEDYRDPKEADYGDDYQDMVSRVKKLAGLGPLKTQYDPKKRVYRNMPTAVQLKK